MANILGGVARAYRRVGGRADGGRRAIAASMLANAGFKHVHNITDGMEGDVVEDPGSVLLRQRLKNGKKNSGCPWTYKLT